jgi:hypothetical protein
VQPGTKQAHIITQSGTTWKSTQKINDSLFLIDCLFGLRTLYKYKSPISLKAMQKRPLLSPLWKGIKLDRAIFYLAIERNG